MSAQNNEAIIRSLFAAFNARKFGDAVKLAANNGEFRVVPTGQTFRGPTGLQDMLEMWSHAFSDGKVEITRVIPTDKYVVVEYTGRGTQNGPLDTPNGTISPTNRKAEVAFCDVATIQDDKIVSAHTYFDLATMLTQLGVHDLEPAHH